MIEIRRTTGIAVLLYVLFSSVWAGEEMKEMPFKFTRITASLYYKSSSAVSLDGEYLAYSVSRDSKEKIWIKSLSENSEEFELPVDVEGSCPSFSPDGKKVLFHNFIDGKPNLYIVGIDGQGLEKLSQGGYNACWSPDGNKIAFVWQHNIGIMNPDGRWVIFLTKQGYNNYPRFSPDGKKIVFYSEGEIRMINVETKEIETIVESDWNGYPVFSPDGKKLALISTRKTAEDAENERYYDLWVLNLETQKWRRITRDESIEYSPSWLPTGDAIVFIKKHEQTFDIWKVEGIIW